MAGPSAPGADGPDSRLVHATCVSIAGCGVLLLGPSGSGKSELALRLIDQPGRGTGPEALTARLVADDQVSITRRENRLFAAPPPSLAGLIEVRGLGIVRVDHAPEAEIRLAVRLAEAGTIERLPERHDAQRMILDVAVPEIAVDAAAASAAPRIRAAVVEVLRTGKPGEGSAGPEHPAGRGKKP